jgi:hypothetical protein
MTQAQQIIATEEDVFHQFADLVPGQSFIQRPRGTSNNLVVVYDRVTGVPSHVLPYMKADVLLMRNPDGELRFSETQDVQPFVGTFICRLNPKHPNYAFVRNVGISVMCKRENLASAMDERMHMQYYHKQEFATLQDAAVEQAREDERKWRELQMRMAEQTLGISSAGASVAAPVPAVALIPCKYGCGKGYAAKNAVAMHERRHCPLRPEVAATSVTVTPEEAVTGTWTLSGPPVTTSEMEEVEDGDDEG